MTELRRRLRPLLRRLNVFDSSRTMTSDLNAHNVSGPPPLQSDTLGGGPN